MNKNEVIILNEQVIDAWNKHDTQWFLSFCHENITWKINGGIETYHGKKEVREYFNSWKRGIPDLQLIVRTFLADEDRISVEFQFSGIHKGMLHIRNDRPDLAPTLHKINTYSCYTSVIKNGKVFETNLYTDRLALMEQLGAVNEILNHA